MTDGRPTSPTGLTVYEHEGPPGATRVVFVHGSMDRATAFAKVVRRLPDLAIVRYDRRGYGRSQGVEVARAFDEHVDDLIGVLAGAPSVVVGHSLGGVIALAAAERHPELVRAVGAFEAPMGWAPWWPSNSVGNDAIRVAGETGPDMAAELFLRRIIGDERWDSLPAAIQRQRRAEGPALVAEVRALRSREAPYLAASLSVPVVSGRGSVTAPQHLRGSAELAATVPGAELFEIEGAGHSAPSTHPEEFAAYVRRVVERASSR